MSFGLKWQRRVLQSGTRAGRSRAAERVQTEILEEELALLGKEQAEPREIDLLLVVFDLREVRVVGEVGDQAAREPVLDVEPCIGA